MKPRPPYGRWAAIAAGLAAAVGAVYAALLLDTAARAREAYREADRYTRWFLTPEAKKEDLARNFEKDLDQLARRKESGRQNEAAYALELDVLRARFSAAGSESPAKRAFHWYRDVYLLYSPPETIWTRRARLLAPAFREVWREEARVRRLPAADSYWDPEPGLAAEERVVFSARRRAEAERARDLLAGRGLNVRLAEDDRRRGAGEGFWLAVPEAEFWDAHRVLREGLRLGVPTIVVEFS